MFRKFIQLSLLMACLGVVLVPNQARAKIERKCTEAQIEVCADKYMDCLGTKPFKNTKGACLKLSQACCDLCGGCRR